MNDPHPAPDDDDLRARAGLDVALENQEGALLPGLRWGANLVPASGPEVRTIGDLAPVLLDPARASGDPNTPVYALYRDVAPQQVRPEIERRGLLYVAAVLRAAPVGPERSRTRGHVNSHAFATATVFPEVIEVWRGRALVYLQAKADPDAGGDVAVIELGPGEKAVVPPGWASLVANIGAGALVYGSWRARDSEPGYDDLFALGGMAHFVLAEPNDPAAYAFEPNTRYRSAPIPRTLTARDLPNLGLSREQPMFSAFRRNPDALRFMTRPQDYASLWTQLLS